MLCAGSIIGEYVMDNSYNAHPLGDRSISDRRVMFYAT
jgi:hypothetical protein